jgi:hypothetical protein
MRNRARALVGSINIGVPPQVCIVVVQPTLGR